MHSTLYGVNGGLPAGYMRRRGTEVCQALPVAEVVSAQGGP